MGIQIIGTKKCPETRKALRFCKERSIEHQLVNLDDRELSAGEWEKIFRSIDAHSLINPDSKYYQKEGYAWRDYEVEEELREHPQLLKTPLLKTKQRVVLGFNTDFLASYVETL